MDSDWDEIRSEAERAVRRGKFDEAGQLWLQAVTLCNDMGKYDSRRIISLEGLANVYWRTNQFSDALPILVKTFSLHEDQLGPDHADIGVLANNLARVYHTLEKFTEAESLYQRALRIQRKVLGVEHPDVAELIKNYANLLVASGRGFEAEDLKASTVSIKSGIWNRSGHFNTIQIDNPDSLFVQPEAPVAPVAPAQNSLAAPPQPVQPDPTAEAVDDGSRTISDDEISAESSGLSNWLNARKATTYEAAPFEKPAQWIELLSKGMEAMQQNNTLQAENLLKKAVAATDTFDPADPRIASTLELYSEALWKNGKLAEAQPICERTLQFYEATLDPKHQDIGVISNNLAMLYHALEKPELAEPMYKRALDIRTANQGTTHPDVITLLNNYANMLYVFHREGEAVNLKNYIRSLTSGKWNQVGKFKAMSPGVAGAGSASATAASTGTAQDPREDQFATFSRFMPSMDKVDWISQSSDVNPTLAEKKETNVKPDAVKPKTEMTEDGEYSNDPRAVLRSLVDGFKKKPGEK
ncbi:MAG: tetratricopeptide repeat protein [Cyanobacteria bacterium SZAS-4]|nr:tetratricopeptide repeat protein [Cyanobacteria bacterium SZAS-4]